MGQEVQAQYSNVEKDIGGSHVGSNSISPSALPGFENFVNGIEYRNQWVSGDMDSLTQQQTPTLGSERSVEQSRTPAINIPETPVVEMNVYPASYVNATDENLNDDALVEAQITWDIRKLMGFKVSNEEHFLEALSRLDKNEGEETQTRRKRGSLKKRRDAVEA